MFIVVAVFLLVLTLVAAFGILLVSRTEQGRMMAQRLDVLAAAQERQQRDELDLLREDILSAIPAFDRLLTRLPRMATLQKLLAQAGLNTRPGKFLLSAGLFSLTCFAAAALWTSSTPLAIFAGAIALALAFAWLRWQRARRFARFERGFPEAMDLLARAIRAGHPIGSGIEMISTELAEPIAGEFKKVHEEQSFGLPFRDAVLNLSERIPLVDVRFFATAVLLQRETGGNLAEILDNLARVIRERFKLLRQVRTFTAQGRLTMIILMSLPPLVLAVMMFINRDFIVVLFTDKIGHALLAAGVFMQICGFFLIRKIINIRV